MSGITSLSSRSGPRSAVNSSTPSSQNVEANLQLLQRLYTQSKPFPCRLCGTELTLSTPNDHIQEWMINAEGSEPAYISGLRCQVGDCQRWTCIGCHRKPVFRENNSVQTSVGQVNHCCDKGRLFGIYIILSRFDEVELQLQERKKAKKSKKSSFFHSLSGKGSGTGYASGSGRSIRSRLGGSKSHDGGLNWQSSTESSQQYDLTDSIFTDLFVLLAASLPKVNTDTRFDKNPPAELFALLRMSLIFDRVSALMRNDSVIELGRTAALYNSLLDFLTTIGEHPAVVKLLVEERVDKQKTPGIQFLGGIPKQSTFEFDNSPDHMGASVIATGLPTFKHVKTYIRLFENTALARDPDDSVQDSAAIALCHRFKALYRLIEQTVPNEISRLQAQSKDRWTRFNEQNRVERTEDVLTRHALCAKFPDPRAWRRGRMPALMKEIASLETSLPPGIFLKISESRPDIMKALIAGPEDSTYEGGLFAFDILLPIEWPWHPPKVRFMLEGYDHERGNFNPNFHADGTVCLSLLGTWDGGGPGEEWQPGQSTLLSVLVSIQAMILGVSDPYENEPKEYRSREPNFHAHYKENAERKVVQYAILYWLTEKAARNGLWGNIVVHYFAHKQEQVLARVRALAESNEGVKPFALEVEKQFLKIVRKVEG